MSPGNMIGKIIIAASCACLGAAALPLRAGAVDFYDGIRAAPGLYFLPYAGFFWADTLTDSSGRSVRDDYGFFKAEELIRFAYYSPDLVLNCLVPTGYVRVKALDDSSAGLGDAWVGAGTFLPVATFDLLMMISAKFPTGEYDPDSAVNFGSNQVDLGPAFFLYKQFGRISLDAALKYYFRLENHATGADPGDELHLQVLLGYEIAPGARIGPGVSWWRGEDKKIDGATIYGSSAQAASAGAEFYFKVPPWSITGNYMADVYSENATRGQLARLKLCYKF